MSQSIVLQRISQHIVRCAAVTSGRDRSPHIPVSLRLILLINCCITLSSCSGGQNFSQFPGFTEYFEINAPQDQLPNESDRALLQAHQPKIYKAIGQAEPIDFYQDYIGRGQLIVNGKKFDEVTSELLNRHRDDPNAIFKYKGDYKTPGTTVVYGRIDRQQINHNGNTHDFTFLTYNLVFPVSGILKGLGALQSVGLAIGGNLNDWHQLDHYIAVTVALLNTRPVAMTLQQHNYHTTYLLEPGTRNVAVDTAMRSNELYPHTAIETKHPAVSFLSADNMEFLITGENKPLLAGFDVTHGEVEIAYQLKFLPQTDAFYQFKGLLGKSRLLPGRSGPPGADYATLPGLLPRAARLVTGYRTDDVQKEVKLYDALFDMKNFVVRQPAIGAFQNRFFEAIAR